MFGLDLITGAMGAFGGGGGGGKGGAAAAAAPSVKQSQDGNTLSSGFGGGNDFNVGSKGAPSWLWPLLVGVGLFVGLLIWKPWK